MALNNFIPQLWAAGILRNLHKAYVYGGAGVINRNYEGEISTTGDTVRITSIGTVTIGNYAKDTDISAPQALTDAQTTLTIDQSKFFNFAIDDVDKAQGNPNVMNEAVYEAGQAMADTADQFIAGLYTDAATANLIGTTASPKTDLATASVPYNYLVDLKVLLDAANVPTADRFCIIPPWFLGYLLKDTRFTAYGTVANVDNLTNGMVGRAAGFNLAISNNVPNTTATKYRIVAGHKMAWTFADQVNKVEAYRPEKRFADALKGLHLYGAKVVKPQALAVLTANPT